VSDSPLPGAVAARRPHLLLWPLALGALGFAAGFFGPLVFSPDANQGPLLGILITGPGGALLGLVLGLAVRLLRLPAVIEWQLLIGAAAFLLFATLYASLPEPRVRGYVIEAEVRGCGTPVQALDRGLRHWERILAGAPARSGWQEDARRSAMIDPGVVLSMSIVRRINIYEHRKPWNRGRITAGDPRAPSSPRRYYARYAGRDCARYAAGTRALYYAAFSTAPPVHDPREWPPTTDIAAFLNLQVIEPIPDEYRRLIEARRER
jgi:hypothetical protein